MIVVRYMIKHKYFLSGFFFFLSLAGFSQQNAVFTLVQCIDSVQQHSYLYQAGNYRTGAAKHALAVSHTFMLPYVSADVGMESRFLRPYNFGQEWAMVHGDWSLGDFIKKTDQVARQQVVTAQLLQEQTRLDAISRGVSLYMSILQKQKESELLDTRIQLLRNHLVVTRSLWKAGVRTRMDVLQTESLISNIREEQSRISLTLRNMVRELMHITGLSPADSIQLEEINAQALIDSTQITEVTPQLLQRNPVYRVYLSRIETQNLQTRLVSARQWPHLIAGGGFFSDGDPTGDGNYWLLNAGVAVPLYQWGVVRHKKKYSEALSFSLVSELADLSRELMIHLEKTVNRMHELKGVLDIQQERLQMDEEAYDLARINYKAGLITNLEYLTVQQQVTSTQIAIQQTQLQYMMNLIEFYLTTNQVDMLKKMESYVSN